MKNALKRYELTDESKVLLDGTKVHRIRALVDIPRVYEDHSARVLVGISRANEDHSIHMRSVHAGDLGGWVEDEENLTQAAGSRSWIFGDAVAYGGAYVSQNARLHGSAVVKGGSRIGGSATIGGTAVVTETSSVFGAASVFESATVSGGSSVRGTAQVRGISVVTKGSTISDCAYIGELAYVYSSKIQGDASVYGSANVIRSIVRGTSDIFGDAALFKALAEDHSLISDGGRMIAARSGGRSKVSMDFAQKFNVVFIDHLEYPMTFTDNYLRVGCQQHTFEKWREMSRDEIDAMDGARATRFYHHMIQIMDAVLAAREPITTRPIPEEFRRFFEPASNKARLEVLTPGEEEPDPMDA